MKSKYFSKWFFFISKKRLKSQIFIFDMILSFIIIIISLGIVLSYFVTTTENIDIYDYNYQILSGFTQTKINSLNNEEVRIMFINNQIRNIDNTVAQQVGEFYHNGDLILAQNLTRIFVSDYVNSQMNFRITIYNNTNSYILFNITNQGKEDIELSTVSSVKERTIFGFINKTQIYGPDKIKIEIWM